MLSKRTDLALEAREIWQESAQAQSSLEGVKGEDEKVDGFLVTRVRIINEVGERTLGKPVGSYITVQLDGIARRDEELFPRAINVVAGELKKMLPKSLGCVLIVGLGNNGITPDAVGTNVVKHVMVTRHLVERMPEMFGKLRQVSAIAPGVLGMTGVESGEIILGVVEHTKPDCIIVADALASRKLSRLCRTIQITDTGIIPGSGVGNSRNAINKETMGVPVIAIGVPTVVDIATIVSDVTEASGITLSDELLKEYSSPLMVTPKEIDIHITDIGHIIGYAINTALQNGITIQDMDLFLS